MAKSSGATWTTVEVTTGSTAKITVYGADDEEKEAAVDGEVPPEGGPYSSPGRALGTGGGRHGVRAPGGRFRPGPGFRPRPRQSAPPQAR